MRVSGIACVVLLAAAAACSDAPTAVRASADNGPSDAQALGRLGFDPGSARDMGDRYLVEGDVFIPKSLLRKGGPSFQYRTYNKLIVSDLRVDYTAVEAVNSRWAAGIEQAMQVWSSAPGANVLLAKHSDPYVGPDITITFGVCDPNSTTVVACADFPSSTTAPGATIKIQDASYYDALSTIVHEFGHVMGLRHTDWANRKCYNSSGQLVNCGSEVVGPGAVQIPGTPTSAQGDAPSVMNAILHSWTGFSYYDRVALRYLFPGGPGPAVTGTLSGNTPVNTWPAMQDAVSYKVYYLDYVNVYDPIFGMWPQQQMTYLTTTTATSYTDYSRSFTQSGCEGMFWPRGYVVKSVFPDGTESGYSTVQSCYY
ncbi:MAG TPA: M57 family metalloprotease [Longimicrobium sp.]|jgi:hypothetical protein|uniref:M57 family metalloprotease n=1 Tax=Longimicrobium sp. TaxID=2029185 RepID=UPI002ED8CCBF